MIEKYVVAAVAESITPAVPLDEIANDTRRAGVTGLIACMTPKYAGALSALLQSTLTSPSSLLILAIRELSLNTIGF